MEKFLGQPSVVERDQCLELVGSWERHNCICSPLGIEAPAWSDPADF